MRKYFEYGVGLGAILTLFCLIGAFFSGISINLPIIGIALASGVIFGLLIALLFIRFSPGETIKEGEEDEYIHFK